MVAEQVVLIVVLRKSGFNLEQLLPLAFYFKTEPKGKCQKKRSIKNVEALFMSTTF